MVKKIRNPETGRMVNVTGKIGQKVLSQRGGMTSKRRKSKRRSSITKSQRGGRPNKPNTKYWNLSKDKRQQRELEDPNQHAVDGDRPSKGGLREGRRKGKSKRKSKQ